MKKILFLFLFLTLPFGISNATERIYGELYSDYFIDCLSDYKNTSGPIDVEYKCKDAKNKICKEYPFKESFYITIDLGIYMTMWRLNNSTEKLNDFCDEYVKEHKLE